jgi:hypothetical protein
VPDYERTAYLLRAAGNALLVTAATIFVLGTLATAFLIEDTGDSLSFAGRGASFTDYLFIAMNYFLTVVLTAIVPAVAGVFFRFLAIQQEQRGAEMELLLYAIAPLDDEDETPDGEVTS